MAPPADATTGTGADGQLSAQSSAAARDSDADGAEAARVAAALTGTTQSDPAASEGGTPNAGAPAASGAERPVGVPDGLSRDGGGSGDPVDGRTDGVPAVPTANGSVAGDSGVVGVGGGVRDEGAAQGGSGDQDWKAGWVDSAARDSGALRDNGGERGPGHADRNRRADDRGRRPDDRGRGNRPARDDGGRGGPRNGPPQSGPRDARRARDDDRAPVPPAPELPEELAEVRLDAEVRRDLLGLRKDVADLVGQHLVAAGTLLEEDPERALAHARYARTKAARLAAVREAVGIAAYHAGEWAEAIAELRAARRMGGGPGHLAVMADAERALGRPERAIELSRGLEARELDRESAIELVIVTSGARRDLGERDAAVVGLQVAELDPARRDPWSARLFYAYADALLAADRRDEAINWFLNAVEADDDELTDATERLVELAGDDLDSVGAAAPLLSDGPAGAADPAAATTGVGSAASGGGAESGGAAGLGGSVVSDGSVVSVVSDGSGGAVAPSGSVGRDAADGPDAAHRSARADGVEQPSGAGASAEPEPQGSEPPGQRATDENGDTDVDAGSAVGDHLSGPGR